MPTRYLGGDGHVEVVICGVDAGGNVAARTRFDFQRRSCEGAVAFQPACCSLAFELEGLLRRVGACFFAERS